MNDGRQIGLVAGSLLGAVALGLTLRLIAPADPGPAEIARPAQTAAPERTVPPFVARAPTPTPKELLAAPKGEATPPPLPTGTPPGGHELVAFASDGPPEPLKFLQGKEVRPGPAPYPPDPPTAP